MLKRISAFCCALLLLTSLFAYPSAAAGSYNEKLYRVCDFYEILDDDAVNRLDKAYTEAVEEYSFGFDVCILDSLSDRNDDEEEYSSWYYEHNELGYINDDSREPDGILLLIDGETGSLYIHPSGSGNEIFTPAVRNELLDNFIEYYSDTHSMEDSLLGFLKDATVRLSSYSPSASSSSASAPVSASSDMQSMPGMPTWYPADPQSFKDFHAPDAPRVVDSADIFTPAEESAMLSKIAAIQNDYGADLVVYTDVSSYGLDHGLFAADFYQFNGYGLGDDYNGSVLFICMEEGNRGWWTAATGRCESLYDGAMINYLDDALEPYMIDGDYGEGVLDYLDNVYNYCKMPDWYPSDASSFKRFQDLSAPRVVDNAGLFTAEQRSELERRIADIRSAYGSDVLILTTENTVRNCGIGEYTDAYYYYNGYGMGDDFRGVALGIRERSGYYPSWCDFTYGSAGWSGEKSEEKLAARIEKDIEDREDFYAASVKLLDAVEKMYKSGKPPKNYNFGFSIPAGIILGLISGLITLGLLKSEMKVIKTATGAGNYLVDGSFNLTRNKDIYLYSHVSRTKIKKDSGSGGGGGGRSSTRSYSSSGGRSFSGGGRRF